MDPVEHLSFKITDGVAEITISRPERRNALTDRMYKGLADWLYALDENSEARCIVIRGSGGILTSGSDISYLLDRTPVEREHHFTLVADFLIAPSRISKPVVAAVQGYALGGGTGLACACDFVVAEEGSVFGVPEVHVGLWPCTLGPAVVRAVGVRKAYEMFVFGERLDAREAQAIGLVTRVVAAETFEEELKAFTGRITALSAFIVQIGKRTFQQTLDMEFEKATRFMSRVMALSTGSEDAREGVTAFLEKRTPKWVDQ